MDQSTKAIVTVVGKDSVGIIAKICAVLSDNNINVLDINQTILDGNFTMIMAVDIKDMSVSFSEIADILKATGHTMSLSIHIQREEIFDAMHTI